MMRDLLRFYAYLARSKHLWGWIKLSAWRRRQLIAFVGLALAVAFSTQRVFEVSSKANRVAQQNLANAKNGRNQTCAIFERNYRTAVQQLGSTYEYIGSLSNAEKKQTLNVFIIRNLPNTEQSARDQKPPTYCEVKGVGLPGKNPPVPERPAHLLD